MKERAEVVVMNAIKKVSKSEMQKNLPLQAKTGRILRTVSYLTQLTKASREKF